MEYSPRLVASLAMHYHDDHDSIDEADAFVDLERALTWLRGVEPALHTLLLNWMEGVSEEELAVEHTLRARTLARLLDQTFELLSNFLNGLPLDIPQLADYINDIV